MSVVKILQYPDPRLKVEGEWIETIDDEVKQVIDDMFETHYAASNCAALAATQLDFKTPKRITVIDFSDSKNQPLCLVNPKIIERKGEQNEVEGCMSVYPDYIHERVKRAEWIKVSALDRDGKSLEFEAEGFMAKCIQHELDHLDGKLYIDHLSSLKRRLVDDKIKKLRRKLKLA